MVPPSPPPQSIEKGWSTMGETCWECLYWAVVYSTPSLCPAPRSPMNSSFVQDLWHLQQADTFLTPVVNPGIKQSQCPALLCQCYKEAPGMLGKTLTGPSPRAWEGTWGEVKDALPTSH